MTGRNSMLYFILRAKKWFNPITDLIPLFRYSSGHFSVSEVFTKNEKFSNSRVFKPSNNWKKN